MALNLTQRRALTEFQEKQFASFRTDLQSILGFEIPLEVRWDEFFLKSEGMSNEALVRCWENIYFVSILQTLKKIATDEAGKSALKAGLRKIVIAPEDIASARNSFSFADGVLTIKHNPVNNDHKVDERVSYWSSAIEHAI